VGSEGNMIKLLINNLNKHTFALRL